ncbi:MAG: DHH family phosphoesterase [Patescibacteria group bacterium]|nr:DHH family phosphoesterase [Patescibacteria group bacterium]
MLKDQIIKLLIKKNIITETESSHISDEGLEEFMVRRANDLKKIPKTIPKEQAEKIRRMLSLDSRENKKDRPETRKKEIEKIILEMRSYLKQFQTKCPEVIGMILLGSRINPNKIPSKNSDIDTVLILKEGFEATSKTRDGQAMVWKLRSFSDSLLTDSGLQVELDEFYTADRFFEKLDSNEDKSKLIWGWHPKAIRYIGSNIDGMNEAQVQTRILQALNSKKMRTLREEVITKAKKTISKYLCMKKNHSTNKPAKEQINKPKIITSYINPDLDAVACIFAYQEFLTKTGSKVKIWLNGKPRDEAKFIIKKFHLKLPKSIKNPAKINEFILADASDIRGIDPKIQLKQVIEIIDHREVQDAHLFPNAKIQIEKVGAAATLIAEKFYEKRITPSKESAILLYSAVISNTLNFQAKVATDRDLKMSKWLKSCVEISDSLPEEMFAAKSNLNGENLKARFHQEFAWFDLASKKIGIVQLEIINGEKLILERHAELIGNLNNIIKNYRLDFGFVTIVDLNHGCNWFMTENANMQKILHEIFKIKFENNVAVKNSLIMRKELVPLIKKYLEQ